MSILILVKVNKHYETLGHKQAHIMLAQRGEGGSQGRNATSLGFRQPQVLLRSDMPRICWWRLISLTRGKGSHMQEVMDLSCVFVSGQKGGFVEATEFYWGSLIPQLTFTGCWGVWGLPRWHVHYRSRTTFVYFFASDLYPACLCCGKALGGKTRELSSN